MGGLICEGIVRRGGLDAEHGAEGAHDAAPHAVEVGLEVFLLGFVEDPGAVFELVFELAGGPAGVAEEGVDHGSGCAGKLDEIFRGHAGFAGDAGGFGGGFVFGNGVEEGEGELA